jgi:hypothetical protein
MLRLAGFLCKAPSSLFSRTHAQMGLKEERFYHAELVVDSQSSQTAVAEGFDAAEIVS